MKTKCFIGRGDPIIAKDTLELRYPISLNPSATFYALTFLEAGNTFPSFDRFNPFNVKRSAGIGIAYSCPCLECWGLIMVLDLINWTLGLMDLEEQLTIN